MVEGKVFIADMRIAQPEASGRIQSSEKRHRLDMVSKLDMAVRRERGGMRKRGREERGKRAKGRDREPGGEDQESIWPKWHIFYRN